MPAKKSPKDSKVIMTELVLPSHTNALGTIFGGTVLSWIDIAGAICAGRHSGHTVVTASLDAVHFFAPITLGQVVTLEAQVTFVSKTSMEVQVHVFSEEPSTGKRKHHVTAFATYVALNAHGKPTEVPPLVLKSPAEKKAFEEGKKRRKRRLQEARRFQKLFFKNTHPS